MREVHAAMPARRSLFWRVHFWAALLASPFALLATFTGLFYVFTPQIERSLYGHLDWVSGSGARQILDKSVTAALAVVPAGSSIRAVLPGGTAADSVRVGVQTPQGEQITVYVDPYRAAVLGQLPEQQRFNVWARKLHSSLLQGDGWRWMIELSASWLLVMLLTGIYLWWPRAGQSGVPERNARGRRWWRQWHAFIGVVLSVLTLIMLTTGITWSKYAGAQVRALRDVTGQASPRAPADLHSTPGMSEALSWQEIWDVARQHAPPVALALTPPQDGWDVWKIGNGDRDHPMQRVDLALEAYSGAVLYQGGWRDQTVFGKATAVGIPFHRGELGLWNQALLLLFGLGVMFSMLSGWVMHFKRARDTRGMPPVLTGAWRALPWPAWLMATALLALLPLLSISAAMVLVIELVRHRRKSRQMAVG